MQRDAGQVDEVDDIGVHELGRQVEGQDVERPRREVTLDAEERDPLAPHGCLHVDPRCVRPLGQRVGPFVEDLVENLESLIGEADLVGVGVHQEPSHLPVSVFGVLGPLLTPDVAGWLGDRGQHVLDPGPQTLHRSHPTGRSGTLPTTQAPPAVVVVVVPEVPRPGTVVGVVVVVGVPNGGLLAGAVWLAGLEGVGVLTVALSGLATM